MPLGQQSLVRDTYQVTLLIVPRTFSWGHVFGCQADLGTLEGVHNPRDSKGPHGRLPLWVQPCTWKNWLSLFRLHWISSVAEWLPLVVIRVTFCPLGPTFQDTGAALPSFSELWPDETSALVSLAGHPAP